MCFFFFKQKTAYEMRISDWSSDVCSSDLPNRCVAVCNPQDGSSVDTHYLADILHPIPRHQRLQAGIDPFGQIRPFIDQRAVKLDQAGPGAEAGIGLFRIGDPPHADQRQPRAQRSEEHTSELQSLMRISYAVFCLKKKT